MDDNNVTIKKEPKAEPTGRFTFNYGKIKFDQKTNLNGIKRIIKNQKRVHQIPSLKHQLLNQQPDRLFLI